MIIIHVGFLMYEVGATRMKNAVSSGVKNLLAFAFMIPTFWLFGWYIYLAFPGGFVPIDLEGYGTPWNVSMGPMLSDQATEFSGQLYFICLYNCFNFLRSCN